MTTTMQPLNLCVFVDYWNFQLSCNKNNGNSNFNINWPLLNAWVAKNVTSTLGLQPSELLHLSTYIYTSYNPNTAAELKFKNWVNSFLSVQSGFNVICLERKKKGNPKCASCKSAIGTCPNCGSLMNSTEEKGVDTRLSVQMLDLAVNGAYDVAALISHDADMIPAVQFVQARGKRVVHFGFTPTGFELRKACSHNFDMRGDINALKR